LRNPKCCAHVQVNNEIQGLVINLHKWLRSIAACVVNQDAQSVDGINSRNEFITRDVSDPRFDSGRRMCAQLGKIVLGTRHCYDACTSVSEPFGASAAYTTSGTCYEGDLSIKHS
jgi:hypothetical protein